jgi:hypothetical protein
MRLSTMEQVVWGRWENEREELWRDLHDLNDDCYLVYRIGIVEVYFNKIFMPTRLNGMLGVFELFWNSQCIGRIGSLGSIRTHIIPYTVESVIKKPQRPSHRRQG